MNYFDGNEFFLVLAIALIIGFIINYLGKKIEYYILALSVLFAIAVYGKSSTMLAYLVGFIFYEYILVLIAQKTESKKLPSTGQTSSMGGIIGGVLISALGFAFYVEKRKHNKV